MRASPFGPREQLQHLQLAADVAQLGVPEVTLPDDCYVALQGMRFHYLDWSTDGQRPILFLHGGGLNAHTWDMVCLALRKEYHCLAFDQRGHGDSDWSPEMDYSLQAHLGDIEAFVDALTLDQFVLVGMSMGGANSIAYASRHSDRLAGLVLVDIGPDVRVDGARRIIDFIMKSAELDSIDAFVEQAKFFNSRRDPRLLRRSLLYNLRQLPNGKWTWKYDYQQFLRADPEELVARLRELWKDIPHISCPALVVRGAESGGFLDEDAEKLATALPSGRWTRVAGAGHTIQGDNPRGLIEALREFFREIGA